MKKAFIGAALLALSAVCVSAQNKENTLVRIGDTNISREEFEFIHQKNNTDSPLPVSKREYLDMFINYKLKVEEAKAQGLDTLKSYKDESQYYFGELSKHYLTDTAALSAAKADIRERMKLEVDASHILVRLTPASTPDDTLKAYMRLSDARNRIANGEAFEKVARQCSDDPSAMQNGGRLGYFSAMQMATPFEDRAFGTPVDSLSPIFRTRFGYHILKVHDRRPFGGEMKVAHIMITPQNGTAEAARATIDSIYQQLQQGADFATLARKHSHDQQSGFAGGEMPWFTQSGIIPEFGKAAFALSENGQISEPVKSRFGWHIIKRIDFRQQRSDNEVNMMIENAIAQGHPAAQAGEKAKALQLRQQYQFRWNDTLRSKVSAILSAHEPDSTKQKELNAIQTVATLANGKTLSGEYIAQNISLYNSATSPAENLSSIANHFILQYEREHLMENNPTFRYTMQEYYDGLLVFEISQRTIWNQPVPDSTALRTMYNANISRYSTGGTFSGDIYICKSKRAADDIRRHISKGHKVRRTKEATVISGTQQQGGIYDEYLWPNIKSAYVVTDGTYTQGSPMDFDKAFGMLVTDYQSAQEKAWVDTLRKKYQPKITGRIR